MTVTLDADARRLLDGRNFGHLTTLDARGFPRSDVVWLLREDDRVLVTSDAKTAKARNLADDPRVALSLVDFDDPYEQLLVRGLLRETRPDPDLTVLDAIARKYLGEPFARRRWSSREVYVLEPTWTRYYHSPLRDPRTDAHPKETPR